MSELLLSNIRNYFCISSLRVVDIKGRAAFNKTSNEKPRMEDKSRENIGAYLLGGSRRRWLGGGRRRYLRGGDLDLLLRKRLRERQKNGQRM